MIESDGFPDLAKRQGLSRPLVKSQRDEEPEGGKEVQAEKGKEEHSQSSDGGLEGKGDSLGEGHPQGALHDLLFVPGSIVLFPATGKPYRDEGDVE
ncbi:MAG: hypothetical protein JRI80_08040 [Deltaproteobacteria bacterium]|nr:hypothetical protein [Deltaproteobacteria bacterium]